MMKDRPPIEVILGTALIFMVILFLASACTLGGKGGTSSKLGCGPQSIFCPSR